jgi:hypothetical protein
MKECVEPAFYPKVDSADHGPEAFSLNVLGCGNARVFGPILFVVVSIAGWMNQHQHVLNISRRKTSHFENRRESEDAVTEYALPPSSSEAAFWDMPGNRPPEHYRASKLCEAPRIVDSNP